jgi:2,3-bisphosphoglycerate-independent phosphoglycerate mutase
MNKLLLLILDGWGISDTTQHNAISQANTPYWDSLLTSYPNSKLHCREHSVGVPTGCLSNSEIGHTAIGAGRVVPQSAFAIDQAIKTGSFKNNDILTNAEKHLESFNSSLHLLGMLSNGGVHSHISHLIALIEWARSETNSNIVLHLFLDGRDMPPKSALKLFDELKPYLDERVTIATTCGRAIGMDRTENWDRTIDSLQTILANSPSDSMETKTVENWIEKNYIQKITDEFMSPARFSYDVIQEHDAIIFFNFRADRMKQMVRLFLGIAPHTVQNDISIPDNLFLASMANYDESFKNVHVLFQKIVPKNNLGEWASKQDIKQLRLTETEKLAHVTYFINGGQNIQYKNEERLIIPSLGLKNYAPKPHMSLPEITKSLVRAMQQSHFELIVSNIANGDMVGHSGDFHAGLKAAKHVDLSLKKIIPAAKQAGYTVLITADHGNLEQMHDGDGPHTAHTFNDVPLIITNTHISLPKEGYLNQIAPTALSLMGVDTPDEMDSKHLV